MNINIQRTNELHNLTRIEILKSTLSTIKRNFFRKDLLFLDMQIQLIYFLKKLSLHFQLSAKINFKLSY